MSFLVPLWRGLRTAEHVLTGAAVAVVVAVGQGLGLRIGWLDSIAHVCPGIGERASRQRQQSCKQAQQARLARAVWSLQAQQFTGCHGKTQVGEYGDPAALTA